MKLETAKELIKNIGDNKNEASLRIVICNPGGIGGTPSVAVKAIHAGFDWDSNSILIYPEESLTALTINQVAEITESVSKGQSWHGFQQYKKYKEKLSEAQAEIDRLKAELAKAPRN